jgi:hypothetical protein
MIATQRAPIVFSQCDRRAGALEILNGEKN